MNSKQVPDDNSAQSALMAYPVVLALDTSTVACSVALQTAQGQVFSENLHTPQSHANQLLPMIEQLLTTAELAPEELDFLVYGEGPGAFTGVRIACGAIQGLALGWNKPVLSMSSLAALSKGALSRETQSLKTFEQIEWLSLVDARMQEVYWQAGVMQSAAKGAIEWQASPVEMLPAGEFMQRLEACLDAFFNAFAEQTAHSQTALVITGDIDKEYPAAIELIERYRAQCPKNVANIFWFDALPSAKAMIELANLQHQASLGEQLAKSVCEQLPKPLYLRNHVADTIAERKAKQAG